VKNSGGRPGGSVTAARFLAKFVGPHAWAHMDIGGTNWWERDIAYPNKPYYVRGNTGTGVRTLVGVVRGWRGVGHRDAPRYGYPFEDRSG
jgi:leucyl aminopeptidase